MLTSVGRSILLGFGQCTISSVRTLVKPFSNLTWAARPIWAETAKLSAVGDKVQTAFWPTSSKWERAWRRWLEPVVLWPTLVVTNSY